MKEIVVDGKFIIAVLKDGFFGISSYFFEDVSEIDVDVTLLTLLREGITIPSSMV